MKKGYVFYIEKRDGLRIIDTVIEGSADFIFSTAKNLLSNLDGVALTLEDELLDITTDTEYILDYHEFTNKLKNELVTGNTVYLKDLDNDIVGTFDFELEEFRDKLDFKVFSVFDTGNIEEFMFDGDKLIYAYGNFLFYFDLTKYDENEPLKTLVRLTNIEAL